MLSNKILMSSPCKWINAYHPQTTPGMKVVLFANHLVSAGGGKVCPYTLSPLHHHNNVCKEHDQGDGHCHGCVSSIYQSSWYSWQQSYFNLAFTNKFSCKKFHPKTSNMTSMELLQCKVSTRRGTTTLDHNKTHYDNSINPPTRVHVASLQLLSHHSGPPLLHTWQHVEESPLQICADNIKQAFHQKYQLCWVWNLNSWFYQGFAASSLHQHSHAVWLNTNMHS